jgi:hypothetical protein
MSVYKPKNSPYFHFDFVWKGRRIFGSTGCRSKRDAIAYENRERQKAALPTPERPPITLDEACGLYEEKVGEQAELADDPLYADAMIAGSAAVACFPRYRSATCQILFRRAPRRALQRHRQPRDRELRAMWRHAESNGFDVGRCRMGQAAARRAANRPARAILETRNPALFRKSGGLLDSATSRSVGLAEAEVIGPALDRLRPQRDAGRDPDQGRRRGEAPAHANPWSS